MNDFLCAKAMVTKLYYIFVYDAASGSSDRKFAVEDYLQKFNELLREDGYELYPAKKISGRDIYEARPYIAPPKITWPENLFSERYKELIEYGNGPSVDYISGVVSWDTKRHFSEIMIEFRQPIQIQPNRYESRTERTDALEVAIDRLRDYDIGLVVDLQYAQFLPGS